MAVTTRRPRQAPSTTDLVAKLDERMSTLEGRMAKARDKSKENHIREQLKADFALVQRARRHLLRAVEITEEMERFTEHVEGRNRLKVHQGTTAEREGSAPHEQAGAPAPQARV